MEDTDEGLPEGLTRQLVENHVYYMIFVIEPQKDTRNISLSRLDAVRKAAISLSTQLTKDYIWQRESFGLQIKNHNGM